MFQKRQIKQEEHTIACNPDLLMSVAGQAGKCIRTPQKKRDAKKRKKNQTIANNRKHTHTHTQLGFFYLRLSASLLKRSHFSF